MRRSASERLEAWVLTGPPGHLYGGVADWAELFSKYLWATRVRPWLRRKQFAR